MMKTLALILLIAVSALASAAQEWTGLRAKWSLTSQDPSRNNSWFELPRTRDDAVSEGWVEPIGVDISPATYIYCQPDDPRVCVLLDSYGHIAGIQTGTIVSDVENIQSVYNMSRLNQYQLKTMFGQEVWTSTAYTKDPAVIANGGGSEIWDNLTGSEGVWLRTTDGIIEVPRLTENLDSVWVEEGCIAGMGTHYYYDIHKTTVCEDIQPWFLFTHEGNVHGIGYQVFGTATTKDRQWYEQLPLSGIEATVVTGPQCMFDLVDQNGVISIHFYFISEPWNIPCA